MKEKNEKIWEKQPCRHKVNQERGGGGAPSVEEVLLWPME